MRFAVGLSLWFLLLPGAHPQQTQQAAILAERPSKAVTDRGSSPASAVAPAAVITNVTITQLSRHVLVRVEGEGQFDALPVSLHNPDRLLLDFAGTRLAMQKDSISSNLRPVRDVRVSQHGPDVVRVIVDLQAPYVFRIVPDGSSLLINFDLPAPSSSAYPRTATNESSEGASAASGSRAAQASPSMGNSGRSASASLQEPEKPALPESSDNTNSGKTNSSAAPQQSTPPVSAPSSPTRQMVMTPFGPVAAPQRTPAATASQGAPSQNPPANIPSAQSPTAATQDASKTQKPTEPTAAAPSIAQQPSSTPGTPAQTVPESQVAPQNKQTLSVALNLENADLYQVLRIIGSELKINYVVDPAVKGTVTINTSGSISREDLFSVLESILQVNGAAIVKQDGYYRVVPATDAKVHPVPLQYTKAAEMPPSPGETLLLQVFPMHYVSAIDMSKILAPFISPVGQVIVNEKGHILLILETPPKLKQVSDMLSIFDSATFSRQRVRLYSVFNNSAKSIIKELQDVFGGYSLTGDSAIRFVPIDSLNAVLAISPSPEAFADVETWIHQLDQPAQQVGEQNFVYPVQNAKASDLRDILIELYGGSVQKPQQLPPSNAPTPNPQNPLVPLSAAEEAQRAQNPQGPERVQGRLHIMSDEKNNALIIQASPHDFEVIKHTIVQLDVLPRQVLIDAKIYSVDLTGNLALGVSYYLNQQSQLPGPFPLSTTGSFAAGQSGGSLLGSTFAIISQTRALQLFLSATDQRSRVRVLSAPSILVTDNTSARIQVGSSVPVPIGSALTPVQSNGSSLFAQTIQYQDTGVILTVTPHINSSGIVTLSLNQEVSSAVPNTTSQIVAPVINKSTFQTSIVLTDGEPLALGGIISTTNSVSRDRIPGLGDIPLVGALFGTTTKKTEREEIVLILTPHVLQNVPQAASQSQEFLERMREVKKDMGNMN
jgi:general secretion pathway protein D